jgi:hypothetical protein
MPASRFAAWAGVLIKIGATGATETGNPNVAATLRGPTEVARRPVTGATGATSPSPSSREVARETEAGATEKRLLNQCSSISSTSSTENNEYPTTAKVAAHRPRAPWRPIEEERAAIVEHDGGIPRLWAEELARLDPDCPPGDVPLRRWQRFVDDVGWFLDSPFCAVAAALCWGSLDLFGCNRNRPFDRVDEAGLLWSLHGDRLVALSERTAKIETRTGARQTYRRKPSGEHRVLAWELVP